MKQAFAAAILVVLAAAGCPGHGYTRDYPEPTVADVLGKLARQRAALSSFTGKSVMDYWLGKDRMKGDVLVMGDTGAKVRFAALSPAGGTTIAEMACDGKQFAFVDDQHNCQLTGPCDAQSIAQFLRVQLQPDDFVALALGTPPVLADATGKVTWDAKTGRELVELSSAAGRQSLVIEMRGGKLDVVSSKRMTSDGALVWSVENADFQTVKDIDGVDRRVPMKSQLKSPQEKADLIVEWKERILNKKMPPENYTMTVQAGVPVCGGAQGAPSPPP